MNAWARAATDTFREAFGLEAMDTGYFREKGEGLFEILDRVSAEEASSQMAGCSSIAAHVRHMAAYLEGDLVAINGGEPTTDWDETWSIQTVDEDQWSRIKGELRDNGVEWMRLIDANPTWENPDWMRGTIGAVAHAAYHLGAIRQIYANLIETSH
jgi:hypothetical protein